MDNLRIGTSGWSYSEWNGIFYPSSSTNKLSFYSRIYNTVEVDSSFYSFPSRGTVHGWARYTPENFVFSVKLPRTITHEKQLDTARDVGSELLKFLSLLRPLIDTNKLGPILIQLPPDFSYDTGFERLRRFFSLLPSDLMFVVEYRHLSWMREEVFSEMSSRNIAYAIVDEPLLPPETVLTADFSFIRWHGRGKRPWYNYRYSDEEIKSWVPKVVEISKKAKRTYGYFNNHFRGFAVENSLKMLKMLGMINKQQEEALIKASQYLEEKKQGKKEKSILEYM